MEKRQVIELTVKKMLCDQAQYFGTYHDIARKQWDDNSHCLRHDVSYRRLYAQAPYVEVDGVKYSLTPSDVENILSAFKKHTLIG